MKQLLALVVVVIAASGGVAFACGGGGGSGCNQGHDDSKCPTLQIEWKNPSSTVGNAAYVHCQLSLTTSTLTATADVLAPGTSCTINAVLANVGSVAVTLSQSISIGQPHACPLFTYTDNLPNSPPRELASGGTFSYQGVIGLSPTAGNACRGASTVIVVTITGTEQSSGCGDPLLLPSA